MISMHAFSLRQTQVLHICGGPAPVALLRVALHYDSTMTTWLVHTKICDHGVCMDAVIAHSSIARTDGDTRDADMPA